MTKLHRGEVVLRRIRRLQRAELQRRAVINPVREHMIMLDTSTLAAKIKELDVALSVHTQAFAVEEQREGFSAIEDALFDIEGAIDSALNLLAEIPEDDDSYWTSASFYGPENDDTVMP
jgi:hypothetical protein